MALRGKLTKDEHAALPEPLREHYKEHEGSFVLDGFVDVGTVREFRENNTRLQQELRGLKDKYGDLDPAAARAAIDEVTKRQQKPDDDVDKRVRDAIEAATKPLKTAVTALETERNQLREKTQRQTFETTLNDAATKAGVQGDYLVDVRARAQSAGFRVVDDGVRAMQGDDPLLDKDGKEVTLDGFLKTLPAPFYGRTQGSGPGRGGAKPGESVKSGSLYNPDALTFGRHAEQIAKGEVQVIRP